MSLTLGLTGMDPATEAALKSAFADANQRLHGHWRLLPETEAEHVVVDMDSMYGPMSWLRLHAAGKRVIGLTTAPRTQTDFRLGRPFDGHQVAELLRDIASQGGHDLAAPLPPVVVAAPPRPGPAVETAAAAAAPAPTHATAGMASTPAPPADAAAPQPGVAAAPAAPIRPAIAAQAPPGAAPVVASPAPAAARPTDTATDGGGEDPAPIGITGADASVAPDPAAAPGTANVASLVPPADPTFADWLAPGALRGRFRYATPGGDALLIDATARQYHGTALLKAVLPCFEGVVREADFAPVDDAAWSAGTATAGPPQPLQRLQWLGGLVAGKGEVLPGQDPDGRYRLNKWPQTEREFPKHFRIATVMMKGPATLPEIAAASGIALEEVVDFVNANLVTGFAEAVPETPPEPTEAPRPAGLFNRLRGR